MRKIADDAFRKGQQHSDRGEDELALIQLHRAKVNDPDGRRDINELLGLTLDRLRHSPSAAPQSTTAPPAAPRATPTPYTVILTAPAQGSPEPILAPATSSPEPAAEQVSLTTYRDDTRNFSISYPSAWTLEYQPSAEVGRGLVSFSDPSGRANFSISTDELSAPVSPELYSARLELAMQQLPGYSLEGAIPLLVGGQPAFMRTFLVSRAGLEDHATRAMQVVLVRRSAALVLTGADAASRFSLTASLFETILASLRFET